MPTLPNKRPPKAPRIVQGEPQPLPVHGQPTVLEIDYPVTPEALPVVVGNVPVFPRAGTTSVSGIVSDPDGERIIQQVEAYELQDDDALIIDHGVRGTRQIKAQVIADKVGTLVTRRVTVGWTVGPESKFALIPLGEDEFVNAQVSTPDVNGGVT